MPTSQVWPFVHLPRKVTASILFLFTLATAAFLRKRQGDTNPTIVRSLISPSGCAPIA
jgi:hypothetical protein